MLPVFTSLLDSLTRNTHGTEKWWRLKRIWFLNRFHVNCVCVSCQGWRNFVLDSDYFRVCFPDRFCSSKVRLWCFMHRSSQRSFWRRVMRDDSAKQCYACHTIPWDVLSQIIHVSWREKFPHSKLSLYSHGLNIEKFRVLSVVKKKSQHFWMILLGLEVAFVVELGFRLKMFFIFPLLDIFKIF